MTAPGDRWVSLMLSDLKGSTALAERFDPETLRAVLGRYFDAVGAVVARHGGQVVKIIGDAVVATFDGDGDRVAAAVAATTAAAASQTVLDELNPRFEAAWGVRLHNRAGVASGPLPADVLAGDVVTTVERLEAGAPVGEVLIDTVTRDLLADAVGTRPHDAVAGAWLVVRDERTAVAPGDVAPTAPGTCAVCGAALAPDARRCERCATPVTWTAATDSLRTVSVVFADPRPTPAIADPDVAAAVMARYHATMAPLLEAHGGVVEKFVGDALMAVFGLRVRSEQDALRAVRAAAALQGATAALNDELAAAHGVRLGHAIAVNTGPVVAGDPSTGQRLVTGDTVNVAARLEQTAADGDVVLGGLTAELVAAEVTLDELAPLVLKGKAEPVGAFRLRAIGTDGDGPDISARPLVGRRAELAALTAVLDDAATAGRARRVTLLGDAGVGKSRVLARFTDDAADRARVVRGGCLAYGEGITFWPLLRVIQDAAGIVEDDSHAAALDRIARLVDGDRALVDRLGSIAGLVATPFAIGELTWAFRRLVELLAGDRPLVVVLDDLHWAEPTLLDVIEDVVATAQAALAVVGVARPDLSERHGPFVDGAPAVTVGPLGPTDAAAFVSIVLGGLAGAEGPNPAGPVAVDAEALDRIVDAAAGNPLFLEHLVSMLVDDGRLRHDGERWRLRGDVAGLRIPATVDGLLAARLDQLPPDERRAIDPASVIGRYFVTDALAHVIDPDDRDRLDERLDALAGRDLVVRTDDAEPAHRFRHQLIRDAAYHGLLKQRRAVLHERVVTWADRVNAQRGRAEEFDEILGYHLEQAHRCWSELGPLDDHGTAIGERGSALLAGAGRRALARGDMHAAANLLGRAVDLLERGHPDLAGRLLVAGNASHESGDFDEALRRYDLAVEAATASGDPATAVGARMEGLRLRYLIGRVDDAEAVGRAADEALAELVALGGRETADRQDTSVAAAAARAWQLRLNVEIAACHWAGAQAAAEHVIAAARRGGEDVLAVRTLPLLAFLAQKGPMAVPDAVARCEQILAEVEGDRRSAGLVGLELATLAAMDLDVDRARGRCDATRLVLGELGWEMQAALVSLTSGPIEIQAGEPARAEAELRRDLDALDRLGEQNFISLTAALLADAVLRQGRDDEAAHLVDFSAGLAAPDDLAVQIVLTSVRARSAARTGHAAAARAEADEAVALMATTDDPSGLGDVLVDRAEVAVLLGDLDAAAADLAAASEAYAAKGNRLGVRRVDAMRAQVAPEGIGA